MRNLSPFIFVDNLIQDTISNITIVQKKERKQINIRN